MTLPPDTVEPSSASLQATAELLALVLGTSDVEGFLADLAVTAAVALPGPASSVGVTLLRDGRAETVASTDAAVRAAEEAQHAAGRGPCLTSLETGAVVAVTDLATEGRWDGYGSAASALGFGSSLSVPLSAEGRTLGVLSLYAASAGAFDGVPALARAASLAAQGSAMLTVVLRPVRLALLTEQLTTSLASRSLLDQATGVLMARHRCGAAEAAHLLRSAAGDGSLRDAATAVIASVGVSGGR